MYMSSNIGSVAYSSREGIINVPEDQRVYYFQPVVIDMDTDEDILHPLLIALTHSLILGEDIRATNTEETKKTLSEDQFNELNFNQEFSNCCICMENKKLNVRLKCNHTFCKICIKKWLTEKSNTCPTCRTEV
jgi:hypothetical protein